MKDLFVINFGVERAFDLMLASNPAFSWLLAGPIGFALRKAAKHFLGFALEKGVLKIDLTLDSIVIAHEKPKYRAQAKALYTKALARVYTDEEKDAIRAQYSDLLRHLGRLRARG